LSQLGHCEPQFSTLTAGVLGVCSCGHYRRGRLLFRLPQLIVLFSQQRILSACRGEGVLRRRLVRQRSISLGLQCQVSFVSRAHILRALFNHRILVSLVLMMERVELLTKAVVLPVAVVQALREPVPPLPLGRKLERLLLNG